MPYNILNVFLDILLIYYAKGDYFCFKSGMWPSGENLLPDFE